MMKKLALALAALLLVAAGPPQVAPPSISPSALGQPNGPALLDAYGRLNAVPATNTPGMADASVVGTTNLVIPRLMTLGSNEFSASFQGIVPGATNSSSSYEKANVYSRIITNDPSTGAIARDAVAYEGQAYASTAGNCVTATPCRIWPFDGFAVVPSGADAYASGGEFAVQNSGVDQPLTGQTNSKNGLHLVGSGTFGGTAAIYIDGLWHDGMVCNTNLTSDCLRMWNGSSTLAEVTRDGTVNATKFGLIGGGTSTATFTNLCANTSGTPYYGACLYGYSNNITSQYSAVGGFAANDKGEYGSAHFASANLGHGTGDSQWGWRVLAGTVATSGTTRLTAQSGIAANGSNSIPIGNNTAMSLDCKLVAHKFNGQDSANWTLDDALFDQGTSVGTARLIAGSWTAKNASAGASGVLTPSLAVDTTNGAVNISVTATGGGPWDFAARCFSTDVR